MILNLDEHPIDERPGKGDDVERFEPERPRQTGLWVAFVLLACACVAAGVHGYRILRNTGIDVAQVPAMVRSLADLSGRLQAAERLIGAWAGDQKKLTDRLGVLERRLNSGLQKASQHADNATKQLEARIEDELDERAAVAEGRLDKLEVAQASNQAQFTQLRTELTNARQEIASLRQSSDSQFAGLNRHLEGSDGAVAALEHRLDRQKVDFEVTKNRDTELTPGVALKVTETNVRRQQFSGWIKLLPETRYLWVNEHGIQQPLAFYRQPDISRFDLVVTRVAGDSVVGYLLMPAANGKAGGPVAQLETSALRARQGE